MGVWRDKGIDMEGDRRWGIGLWGAAQDARCAGICEKSRVYGLLA